MMAELAWSTNQIPPEVVGTDIEKVWDLLDFDYYAQLGLKTTPSFDFPAARGMSNLEILEKLGTQLFSKDFANWEAEARKRGISPLQYIEPIAAGIVFGGLAVYGAVGFMALVQQSPKLQQMFGGALRALYKVGGLRGYETIARGLTPMYAGFPVTQPLSALMPKHLSTVGALQKAVAPLAHMTPAIIDKLVEIAVGRPISDRDILVITRPLGSKAASELEKSLLEVLGLKRGATPNEMAAIRYAEAHPEIVGKEPGEVTEEEMVSIRRLFRRVEKVVKPVGEPYPGFDTTTTGMSYYDAMLKPGYFDKVVGLKATIEAMTPDDYLARSAVAKGVTEELDLQVVDTKLVDEYAEAMKRGDKFPMLLLEDKSQEGKHRALAARKAGIKEVPVFVVTKPVEKPKVKPPVEVGPLSHLLQEDFIRPTTTTGEGAHIQKILFSMKDKTGQELYDYAKDDTVKMEEIIRAAKDNFRVSALMSEAHSLAELKVPGEGVGARYIEIAKKEHYGLLRTEIKSILFPRVEESIPELDKAYISAVKPLNPKIAQQLEINELARLHEEEVESIPGVPVTEKEYAAISGKLAAESSLGPDVPGLINFLKQLEQEPKWWQEYEAKLSASITEEQFLGLAAKLTEKKILGDDLAYFIKSITYGRADNLKQLNNEQAMLIDKYLDNLPKWDPDAPIPPVEPPAMPANDPGQWRPTPLDYVQNMEAWFERMEAKYPATKLFTDIGNPAIQARRTMYAKEFDAAKWGLEAIKGLSDKEMADIQLWTEEEYIALKNKTEPKHTVTLTERQVAAKDMLQMKLTEIADFIGVEERIPGKVYLPRRYATEFLEKLGIRRNKHDFAKTPYDYLGYPKSFKPFFKYERSIEQAPKKAQLNLFSSYMAYVNQGLRAYYLDTLEATTPAIKKLGETNPALKKYVMRWAQQAAGSPGFVEGLYLNLLKKANIPPETAKFIERMGLDLQYFGGLGAKASFPFKNFIQFFHYLSEIPVDKFMRQLPLVFSEEGQELWRKSGVQMHYAPFMRKALPKATGTYQALKNTLMAFVQGSDFINRYPAYIIEYGDTWDIGNDYTAGKITWDDLITKLDIKRYEKPFQDIILTHLREGRVQVAADLMGDRAQAYTNWRYWSMVSPMLLEEQGPMLSVFQVWGFDNLDLMWRRRVERGVDLIKEGDVKSGVWQFQKILRHIFMIAATGYGIKKVSEKITNKDYDVGATQMLGYLLFGSIPSGLAPMPQIAFTGASWILNSLAGRDWLAQEAAQKLKRQKNIFIPAGLALRDYWAAFQLPPGEAFMRVAYPQFRPKTGVPSPAAPDLSLIEMWKEDVWKRELPPFSIEKWLEEAWKR